MSFINKKELQEQFLLENKYGLKGRSDQEKPWPRNTTLLYCTKMYDVPYSSVPSNQQTGCSFKTNLAPIWCRLDNESRSYKLENGEPKEVDAIHAEIKMVKQIMADLGKIDQKPRKLDVTLVMNYTPCNDCADVLIDFKKYVQDGLNVICNMKVKFSSFYNCHLPEKSLNNLPGLCKLHKNSICVETFSGTDDWNWFLKSVLNMTVDIESLFGLSEERKEREAIDDEILHGIKFHMETDGRPELVPFAIGKSAALNDAQSTLKEMKRNAPESVNAAANRLKNLDIDIKANVGDVRINDGNTNGDASISICIPSVFATIGQLSKPGNKRKAMKKGNNESYEQQQRDDNIKAQRYNGHEGKYGQRRGNRGNGYMQSGNRQGRGYGYRGQGHIDNNYDEVDDDQFMGYQHNYQHRGRPNRRGHVYYDYE